MSFLAPTPPDRMVDARGRPYFLWDEDTTLSEFRAKLDDGDPEVRAYYLGKLMRQAKPDDVFTFVTAREIGARWRSIERFLGHTREFWTWLLDRCNLQILARRADLTIIAITGGGPGNRNDPVHYRGSAVEALLPQPSPRPR
jgi:hypothetical protein